MQSNGTVTFVYGPDEVLGADRGDDTARRYVYQWTCAAVLACGILDDSLGVLEIFCEHHEDILVKHHDGLFTGQQVKTRVSEADPWKAGDPQILSALCRFVALDTQFPGRFKSFVIATNHTFLTGKRTSSCLPHLIDLAMTATDCASVTTPLRPFLTKLSKESGATTADCLNMLRKCRCDSHWPKLDDAKRALMGSLVESRAVPEDTSIPEVSRIADALIAECQRASSLDHAQALPTYVRVAVGTEADSTAQATIEGKRINRSRIETVLRSATAARSLLTGPPAPSPLGEPPRRLLDLKLSAGGFSAVSVNSAKDLRDTAEHHSLEWIHRLGEKDGLARHRHVRSLVLSDCGHAFEAARRTDRPFGIDMRHALRRRFEERRVTGGATLFDCLDEHLEGHAYSLTNECKVWWSEPFDVPKE